MSYKFNWVLLATMSLLLGSVGQARADTVVYATADNGTTNLFGTMDLTTGQFTQLSTTTPLFGALTAGNFGTLYGGDEGNPPFSLYTISPSGATSPYGTVTAPSNSIGFYGLASAGTAGYFADAVTLTASYNDPMNLYRISADGKNMTVLSSTVIYGYNSGNLAYGPDGNLYINAKPYDWYDSYLWKVNPTTGSLTYIMSFGQDPLTLLTIGSTFYGIDTIQPTDPTIYTINTKLGVATPIGTVSGLPGGYTVDTMAAMAASTPVYWALAVSGSWNSTVNWTSGVMPNAVGAGAAFSASTSVALPITLNEPVTLGTLQFGNSGSTSVGYALNGSGSNSLTFSNSGSGATITVVDGSHVIDVPVVLADNLMVTGNGTLAFGNSSSITETNGSHSLTKTGTGLLVLSGDNSYSGGTTVSAGVLTFLTRAAQPTSGTTTVAAGATLGLGVGTNPNLYGSADLDNLFGGKMSKVNNDPNSNVGIDTTAGNFTYASNISATTMGLSKLGPNTLTLTGSNRYTGITTISGGTLQLGDGTAGHDGIALTGNIVNNAALVYNLNGNQSYSGTINGSGSVTKTGTGTLTLGSNSNYSGPTVISGGTLKLSPPPLPAGTVAYYAFDNPNNLGQDSSGNGNNLTTGAGTPAYSASGKFGAGALSLNGDSSLVPNSRSGITGLPIGNSAYTIATWMYLNANGNDGIVGWGNYGTDNQVNAFRTAGNTQLDNYWWGLDLISSVQPSMQGNWHYVAATWNPTTDNRVVYLDGTAIATDKPGTHAATNANFAVGVTNSNSDEYFNGLLDNLLITNTTLSQSQIQVMMNYSGVGGVNVLPAMTPVLISNGATLDLNGSSQQVASLSDCSTGSGGSIINSNTGAVSILTLSPTGGSTTFSGSIMGSGTLGTISLVMSGSGTQVLAGSLLGPGNLTVNAGTLILSGSNSYTGGTDVAGGMLTVTNAAALPDGTSLTVGTGAALFGGAAVPQTAAPVPEPGTLALLAAGALVAFAAWRRRRN